MAMPSDHPFFQLKDYSACLRYIERTWKKITFRHPHDKYVHLGLPYPFVSPNDGIYRNDQFYWDSYFILLGLVRTGREFLARGMVDNLLYLRKRFRLVPMRNRFYNLGSSQIPFLTSMAREVYSATGDKAWFRNAMKGAEEELSTYWMNRHLTEIHIVYQGLSRYCDHYITHLAAEHESGWDMTSRFHSRCLDYLPVDLNCALYKYETDLAEFYKLTRNRKKYEAYTLASEKRRRTMNRLFWNFRKGFYFDYDYKHRRQSNFYSIAGFYPLWARMATYTQARRMVDSLRKFEYPHGLANTQPKGLSEDYRQHDYPNGWPHQQWIVIRGLMNYGFTDDAFRLARKYLEVCRKVFRKTGKMWEKYDVVKGSPGKSERYTTQSGFGWTNAVFVRLFHKFSKR